MTAAAPAGSERTEFTTTDPDVAWDFIDRAYGRRARPPTASFLATRVDSRAQQWTHTVDFVHDLVADKTCSLDRLVVGRVARLLAATALVVFPNEVRHGDLAAVAADATPATVRRAVAHIESYPDSDLSVVDIATAARVSVRAVQLAFRRHLDTTPMAYLRRVRLDRAHRDLLAADPAGSETVTSVAARWGFAHPRGSRSRLRPSPPLRDGRLPLPAASVTSRRPATTVVRGVDGMSPVRPTHRAGG